MLPSSADLVIVLVQVMELVELEALKGSLVGIPGRSGLSVEQRKRLTIAVELVANPSVVFMDEPTSGADLSRADVTLCVAWKLLSSKLSVVCPRALW